jgi:hypothetical protein
MPPQPSLTVFDIPANAIDGPAYMLEALSTRALNYSLYAAVEVAKKNAFRISCVWQMVTSHLRMMSSHKVLHSLSSLPLTFVQRSSAFVVCLLQRRMT